MQLYHNSYGSPSYPALIILHGLLGSSDNWHSFGWRFGEQFHTLVPDARNHGRSPHSDIFDYQAMAEDIVEFLGQNAIGSASLLGHSMGGKTAALVALLHPELVDKLIVVDIAPGSYRERHDRILEALLSLDLTRFAFRKDIDTALMTTIPDSVTRQFLMKNLARDESGRFHWKMNLQVIDRNYDRINEELPSDRQFDKRTLFVRGEHSDYIQMDDLPLIRRLFPKAEMVTVKNAGHWVHADAPEEFFVQVLDFLTAP